MALEMRLRMLYTPFFHIDTNLINARGGLDTMNQIEKWASDGLILVHMSRVSFEEAQAGGHQARTRKALSHIFTGGDETFTENNPRYREIEGTFFPGGAKTNNQRNDVKIVYEADRWGAPY